MSIVKNKPQKIQLPKLLFTAEAQRAQRKPKKYKIQKSEVLSFVNSHWLEKKQMTSDR